MPTAKQLRDERIEEKRQKQTDAGIPDSRIHAQPPTEENPILDLHVGGVQVRHLPIENQGRILYQQTDEGVAEYNKGKSPSAAVVTSDPYSKSLAQRFDQVADLGLAMDEAVNPMKDAADRFVRPGFRGKFFSKSSKDSVRGMGMHVPVLDDDRKPVTVGGMPLGEIPENIAAERNRRFQNKSRGLLQQMTEKFRKEGGETAVVDR